MTYTQLSVEIEKKYPAFELKVSFTSGEETLGLLGASGSGKSMTLRCIAGLETPDSGRILLNGRVLFDSEKKINLPCQKRNIGFLFQNFALFPHMTVAQNIAFGLSHLSKEDKARRVAEKLAMVRLESFAERYPYQLSGGQQQRVALARALAPEPEALLLDEPFSALDNHLRNEMEKQLILAISGFKGPSLFVTHNMEEAYRVSQDLLILDEGKKIGWGPKEDIFRRPPTLEAARLTGCKNFSRARAVSAGIIEALDWGCLLHVTQPIPANISYVGIRAHYLTYVDEPGGNNTFPCWLVQTREGPHRISLYLQLNSPPDMSGNYQLHGELFKEKWADIKDRPSPWLVHLNPDHLFMM